jgi:hypothetical protein
MDTSTPLSAGRAPFPSYDEAALRVLHEVKFPGTSLDEFRWIYEQCRSRGINPFSNHVYHKKQWNDDSRQPEILLLLKLDGFRSAADDTGLFRGTLGPYWCGEDGRWSDVWLSSEFPYAARVGVKREGFPEPIWRTAKWSEFAQYTDDACTVLVDHWYRMPAHMLGVRAEVIAFRAAFPEKLGGVYLPDELERPPGQSPPPTEGGGPRGPRYSVPSNADGPVITPDAPLTPMQLHLALIDRGYKDEAERNRLIARWRQQSPLMYLNNPQGFNVMLLKGTPPKNADAGVSVG